MDEVKKIADVIEAHLEWACQNNKGRLLSDELAKTILQIFEPCRQYAEDLATALWKDHYSEDAPEWEPLDSTMEILTQIDNMTCQLVRPTEGTIRLSVLSQFVDKLEKISCRCDYGYTSRDLEDPDCQIHDICFEIREWLKSDKLL